MIPNVLRFTAMAALIAVVVPGVQGCGCNLVGCVNGITVHLASLPSDGYQVELLVNGVVQVAQAGATCTGAAACSQDIFFNVTPSKGVSIRVTTSAGTRVTAYANVEYAKSRPNGSGCDPECRSATVTAELPV